MALSPIQKIQRAMRRLMSPLMPSCKEVTQLASAAMDCELPLQQRLSIRFHVLMCLLCRRYKEHLHLLRFAAMHYAEPDDNLLEERLSPAASDRLKQAMLRGS